MVSGVFLDVNAVETPAIQMLLKISVVQMIDSSMKVLKVNKSLLHKMTMHLDWLDTTFFFFSLKFSLTT